MECTTACTKSCTTGCETACTRNIHDSIHTNTENITLEAAKDHSGRNQNWKKNKNKIKIGAAKRQRIAGMAEVAEQKEHQNGQANTEGCSRVQQGTTRCSRVQQELRD